MNTASNAWRKSFRASLVKPWKRTVIVLPGYGRLRCAECPARFRLLARAIAHINKAHP